MPARRSSAPLPPVAPPPDNLAALFEKERRQRMAAAAAAKRDRDVLAGREAWKPHNASEADVLRAECKILRIQNELAARHMERRNRAPTSSPSAMATAGRKKIDGSEEDMAEIERKMRGLRTRNASASDRRLRRPWIIPASDHRKCPSGSSSSSMSPEAAVVEDQDLPFTKVEVLRKKMEGASRGMTLGKVAAEHWRRRSLVLLSRPAAAAADEDRRRTSNGYRRQIASTSLPSGGGCECCREVIRRVMEEASMELKQWGEMQELLDQVQLEMAELRHSRDLLHRREAASDLRLRRLHSQMMEWKQRAEASEMKVVELQREAAAAADEELRRSSTTTPAEIRAQPGDRRRPRQRHGEESRAAILLFKLKDNKRSPLSDIGNKSCRH